MLTSTLTKPTTINPTLSCRRRVNLLESINIAPFPAPKARIVTLEPVSKRSRPKATRKASSLDAQDSSDLFVNASRSTTATSQRPPLSRHPSTVSSSSPPSNSSQSFQTVSDPSSGAMRNNDAPGINSAVERTIVAKTEVMRAGVLPGDTLPVKLTIHHNKQVRSAHGVIVTLYRQGRIDLHPSIPIGNPSNGKKPVYEDVYPRSRTGLGGLSIGSSPANSMFRKDLSQTFAPLVVDPTTLTAVVKTSIRIPENAFPTITRTPGSMINFRYYVEVVADLRGKLTLPERVLPRFSMVSGGRTYSSSGQILNVADASASSLSSNWAGNILDTDPIRREKGVISVAFEVVVGTHDSERGRKEDFARAASGAEYQWAAADTGDWQWDPEAEYTAGQEYEFPRAPQWLEPEPYQPLGQMIPAPESQGPVDEKAQVRQAEETLLPSRPPAEPGAGASGEIAMPTAPVLPEDDHIHDYQHMPPPSNGRQGRSADSVQTIVPDNGETPGDDKQELERRRLMQQASAPEEAEHAGEGPSAPMLDDDDQLVGGMANGDESLPQYQR